MASLVARTPRRAPLRLTELEAIGDELAFAGTAEATASAYDDGQVAGSVVGRIHRVMSSYQVAWCPEQRDRVLPVGSEIPPPTVRRRARVGDRLLRLEELSSVMSPGRCPAGRNPSCR